MSSPEKHFCILIHLPRVKVPTTNCVKEECVCLDSRSISIHLYMSTTQRGTHICIHTVHNVHFNRWLFLFIRHECHCSTFYLVDSVFVYNDFKYIYHICIFLFTHIKRCIAFYEDKIFRLFWLKVGGDVLDFTDFKMRWQELEGLTMFCSLHRAIWLVPLFFGTSE